MAEPEWGARSSSAAVCSSLVFRIRSILLRHIIVVNWSGGKACDMHAATSFQFGWPLWRLRVRLRVIKYVSLSAVQWLRFVPFLSLSGCSARLKQICPLRFLPQARHLLVREASAPALRLTLDDRSVVSEPIEHSAAWISMENTCRTRSHRQNKRRSSPSGATSLRVPGGAGCG